jgi:hypothetical protein
MKLPDRISRLSFFSRCSLWGGESALTIALAEVGNLGLSLLP